MTPRSFATPMSLLSVFPWARMVRADTLRADALAGLLGAMLVLPQAFAFAALAGLPPEFGIATAVVPCAVAALAGSSWHVHSGPTNANSLALFAALAPLAVVGSSEYIQLALAVTLMVGALQMAIGALRLGALTNFISPASLKGFTGGAALLIALYAIPDLLGLERGPQAAGLAALFSRIGSDMANASAASILVAVTTAALALLLRRLPRWPTMLMALAAGTLLAALLHSHGEWLGPVQILSRVPSALPHLSWPFAPPADWGALAGIALALTIVALGQDISIAKAVAERSGQRIDANREFFGQGLSNVVGSFFSSYVSCGSMNRSMPNFDAGARTPLSAVFSAMWLVVAIAVAGPLLAWLSYAAIAGLLIVIAISLLDLPAWKRLASESRQDFAVALATLASTLVLRIDLAIVIGTGLSLLAYLYRTSQPHLRTMGFDVRPTMQRVMVERAKSPAPLPECPQLKLVRMEGDVYFGAVAHIGDSLERWREEADQGGQKHLLVMSKSMNHIDAAGARMWARELDARRAMGGDLYFHRPRPDVLSLWHKSGFIDRLGSDHLYPSKDAALRGIVPRLDLQICAACTVRCFVECSSRPQEGERYP